jgi:hypothetical protein
MQRFDGRDRLFKWPFPFPPKFPLEVLRSRCYASRAARLGERNPMKLLGFLFLLAGWAIVVCALALLQPGPRVAFVLAGMGVEILGLVLIIRSHPLLRGEE